MFKNTILKTKSGLDSRSFFILPSREHAERIQNLVLKKDGAGLFNAHILTINDLAARFLNHPLKPQPSEALRIRILREILGGATGFPYFEPSRQIAGFHRLLADRIKEFKSSLLSVSDFEKRAQSLLGSGAFRLKFRDFTVLLKNYEKRLSLMGFAEPEDAITELAGAQVKAHSADLVVFDGFYHFSRAQMRLVGAISRGAAHTVVTLTVSEKEGARPDLFYYPERTRASLKQIGFREKKSGFKVNHRAKNPALLYLEANLFSKKMSKDTSLPEGICIFEAPHMRGEVEMIVREIRRLSREESLYLSDICVILRAVSPYQKWIVSVFEHFGVAVHIHERFKLKETALGAFLYRFLNLGVTGWTREDVLYLVKTGFCGRRVRLEDVLRLERLSFSENVSQGREAWLALGKKKGVPDALRSILEEWAGLEKEILSAEAAPAFTLALKNFVRRLEPAEEEAEKSVGELLRNIELFFARSGQTAFGPAEAAIELQGSIETALFSKKAPGKNCVQVYDAVMALPKEYKVVFIAGLLEKRFPQSICEDALFKDSERRALNEKDIVLEERTFRIAGERYFFYMALTRARERVYLTYTLYDADERPCLASFFVEEVKRCFNDRIPVKTRHLSDFLPAAGEWETQKEALRGLAGLIGDPRRSPGEKNSAKAAMRDWLSGDPFREMLLWAERDELEATIGDPRIQKILSQNSGPFSATRLEEMAACAFRHFASQTLGLKEPADGREAMEMGTALHKTLETYFRSLSEEARKTGSYLKELGRAKTELKALLVPIAKESPLSRGKPYRFKTQILVMQKALDLFAETEKELFEQRGFAPTAFELKFGTGEKADPGFLEIQDGLRAIRIRGQIDRLDVSPDGKRAVVADYKLSKRPSVHRKLDQGLELQLPLYLLAAGRVKGYDMLGAEHRYLKEPGRQGLYREDALGLLKLGSRETLYSHEEFEELLSRTEERVRKLVERLRAADITVKSKSCDFCKFSPVCRFEPWRLVYSKKD